MAAISKHWNEIIHPGVTCATLSHPGKTCEDHLRHQMRATIGGNLKFFVPISIVRLFMLCYTRKTLSVEVVLQALFELVSESFNGWAVSNCWSAGFCAMYRWFGWINNYSVSLPSLPGTLLMFLMPAYVKMSHSRAIFNVFLECWIKSREHPLVEYARESKVIGTVSFMAISAAIAYYAQRTKAMEFWFFAPLKKNLNPQSEQDRKPCYHRHACQSYILEGMRTCFTFGLLLELIRKLINVAPRLSKEPVDAILEALARLRLRFVAFLTLYNGLFRLTTCALARHRGEVVQSDSTLAGCVSGLSYALSPNYNIFNLGVAAVIQNAWNYLVEKYAKVNWLQQFNKLSFSSVVWVFLMNYNMYARAYYPYAMSKFAMKFTDICSGSQAQIAAECLGKVAMGFS
ncbi:uncharacterized protein LOC115256596 [Aedes albopictus]|uniref:Transmembrane protein 135 N-terminal domain-containing protein n=1 Tax=Aedes albopictus TaxID=7160 RepID=A0ABM1XST0_AEDAL|nr:uncharacterized protein LOC115256596 [Aedes albopictus]